MCSDMLQTIGATLFFVGIIVLVLWMALMPGSKGED